MEIVVHARTHDDLRTPLRINGIAGEFRGDTDSLRRRHPGQLFLPGRRAHLVGIVEVFRPGARQIQLLPVHPVVRQHHVEHRGDQVPIVVHDRHATVHDPSAHGAFLVVLIVRQVEPWQEQFHGFLRPGLGHRHDRVHIIQVQVPLAHAFFTIAVSQGAARVHNRAVLLHHQQPVCGIWAVLQRRVGDIRRGEELAWGVGAVAPIIQSDEERGVREPPHVVEEERFLLAHMEFRQDHMSHGHGQRPIGAGGQAAPLVGKLGVVRKVRGHHHNLRATVARLRHEVGVRGTSHRNVRTPHNQV